jgi:hypothetical protein
MDRATRLAPTYVSFGNPAIEHSVITRRKPLTLPTPVKGRKLGSFTVPMSGQLACNSMRAGSEISARAAVDAAVGMSGDAFVIPNA